MAFRNGFLISRFCHRPCKYSVVKDPCLQLKLPGAFGSTRLYQLLIREQIKKSDVSHKVKQFESSPSQLTNTTKNPDQEGLGNSASESAKQTEEPQSSKSAKQTEEPQRAKEDTVIGIIQLWQYTAKIVNLFLNFGLLFKKNHISVSVLLKNMCCLYIFIVDDETSTSDSDDDEVRRQQIEKVRQLMKWPKTISQTEVKVLQQKGAGNSISQVEEKRPPISQVEEKRPPISQVEEKSPPTKRRRHRFKLV
jgi:hypothetical protein